MTMLTEAVVGKYRIVGELGRGGMATVYRAIDLDLQRIVALKVLPEYFRHDPTLIQRFKQEAIHAAKLNHPNIITIYDVGEDRGLLYFAMEYIEGQTLSQLIHGRGPLRASEAVAIIEQVASALDYAHGQGYVHRDVKPTNILLDNTGRAILTDFGIVKAADGTSLTRTRAIVGTPEYMSPEQVQGGQLGRSSDIYSLGVVCYEMLAGKAPFGGETASVLHAQVYERPTPLHQLNPHVSPAVERVVERTLSKEPGQRYATAGEMATALERAFEGKIVEEPVTVAAEAPPGRVQVPPREQPMMVAPVARRFAAVGAPMVLICALMIVAVLVGGAVLVGTGGLTPATAVPAVSEAPSMPATIAIETHDISQQSTVPPPCGSSTETFTPSPSATATSTPLPPTYTPRPLAPTFTTVPLPVHSPTNTATPTHAPRPAATPTATISLDPTVYDNFNNPAYDGTLDWSRWNYWSEPPNKISQRDGLLVFAHPTPKSGEATALVASRYDYVPVATPTFFEAALLLSAVQEDGCVELKLDARLPDGGVWYSSCHIWAGDWAACVDSPFPKQDGHDYQAGGKSVDRGTWHTFRVEVNPGPMSLTYFIDAARVGSHVPVDADRLKGADFALIIGVWGAGVTGHVDDVRVGPVG